jgi:acyl-CoA thioesterase
LARLSERPTTGLAAGTAVAPLGDGRFAAEILEEWWGGAGPHGGYVAAIVLRALVAALDDPARPPRSLTLHFLSPPAVGPCEVAVTTERAGRSLSALSARLEQEGRVRVLALAAFSGPWPALEHAEAERPPARSFDAAKPIDLGGGDGPVPVFFSHLEIRPTLGGFTGGGTPTTGGWIRLDPPERIDAPAAAFFLDAWWPAVFALLDRPAGAPTIDLTVHFRRALPATPDGDPVLARFTTRLVHDGFFEEDGELWSVDGELLAQSRQLALLRV